MTTCLMLVTATTTFAGDGDHHLSPVTATPIYRRWRRRFEGIA
ncbi:MAG: hypothetical protein ABIS17_08410 [Casimicrobiaceae bacterium]